MAGGRGGDFPGGEWVSWSPWPSHGGPGHPGPAPGRPAWDASVWFAWLLGRLCCVPSPCSPHGCVGEGYFLRWNSLIRRLEAWGFCAGIFSLGKESASGVGALRLRAGWPGSGGHSLAAGQLEPFTGLAWGQEVPSSWAPETCLSPEAGAARPRTGNQACSRPRGRLLRASQARGVRARAVSFCRLEVPPFR